MLLCEPWSVLPIRSNVEFTSVLQYANQSEESMKPAWYVFDVGGRGEVDISAFRKAMPLMGENVAPEKMEKLFQEADADGSGP